MLSNQRAAVTGAQIWLIGGTRESAELAQALAQQGVPFVVSVTTPSARRMYGTDSSVWVGAIPPGEMAAWLKQRQVTAILDASHPFAVEVSQGAIAVATQLNLPYLRFERNITDSASSETSCCKTVPNLDALLSPEHLVDHRTLLVLGYRMLHRFKPWHRQAQLFARILPSQVALAAALEAGFQSNNLIALRPPISKALEISLWKHWGITQVIAKASGPNGGELIKRQVSDALGVPLWLLERPQVNYPQQTQGIEGAILFAKTNLLNTRQIS